MFTQNRDIRTERQTRPWIKYAAVVGVFALAMLFHIACTPTPLETAVGDVLMAVVVASPVVIVMLMLGDVLRH